MGAGREAGDSELVSGSVSVVAGRWSGRAVRRGECAAWRQRWRGPPLGAPVTGGSPRAALAGVSATGGGRRLFCVFEWGWV